MESIRHVIVNNVSNVAKLANHPTHQLRVLHSNSCVPEVIHETRRLSSLMRYVSNDSRTTILYAIERTLRLLLDRIPITTAIRKQLLDMQEEFKTGIERISTHYESDITVETHCDRIQRQWDQICDLLQESIVE